ncbi:putative serine/threonine-protein phosphatase PP2A catalytic subunit-like [Capsicum annuum]|nr:putative serine/threonine-protein phosphatase PP2A catalytic subunit-like [Capsicum annuum]
MKNLSDCTAIRYNFDIEDVLLGEKSDSSMIEFRPCSVTEFSQDNIVSLSEKTSPSSSVITQNISNEDTMQEYTNLKLSLLLYDAILTIVGSSITFLAGEKSAIAFLTGGIGGFLYLLLVQKSVDVTSIAAKYALGDVARVYIVGICNVKMSAIR